MNRKSLEIVKHANTPDFDKSQWIINPDLSKVRHLPKKYWLVRGDEVVPVTDQARKNMDESEIGKLKEDRYAEFEQNSARAIQVGFEYPAGAGTKISMFDHDRITLLTLSRHKFPIEVYPIVIQNKNGGDITMNSISDVEAVVKADAAFRFGMKKSELELKRRVRESQTIEAVNFVADRRV
jgi:hypothetical protein